MILRKSKKWSRMNKKNINCIVIKVCFESKSFTENYTIEEKGAFMGIFASLSLKYFCLGDYDNCILKNLLSLNKSLIIFLNSDTSLMIIIVTKYLQKT